MTLSVIVPPAPVVALADAKAYLRVDTTDDDALITALIVAAQGQIDGPPGWLGRSIGVQTLELVSEIFDGDSWGGIVLPCQPLIDIVSVSYADTQGGAQIVDASLYTTAAPATIRPLFGKVWPLVSAQADAVRIRYRAGYLPTTDATPVSTVPAPITAALMMMVADLYQNRDTKQAAAVIDNPTVARLLAPFRVWSA